MDLRHTFHGGSKQVKELGAVGYAVIQVNTDFHHSCSPNLKGIVPVVTGSFVLCFTRAIIIGMDLGSATRGVGDRL
jgi:hypothetical protein